MIFGFGAALLWGAADLGAALSGRRIGSFPVVLITQASGLVAIGLTFLLVRPAWTGSPVDLAPLVVNGVVVAAAYVLHYRALELGPVALVSPVTSAYGVVPIVLAVAVLGEHVTPPLLVGSALTILGVVLASTNPRRPRRASTDPPAGLPYAVTSMLLFGLATFVVARAARAIGWLPTVAFGRLCTFATLTPIALRRRPTVRTSERRGALVALAVGVVDIAGIAVFSRGAQVGSLSVVTAVSATFPLIPFVGGLVLLGERPVRTQVAGVACVLAGLIVLGLMA